MGLVAVKLYYKVVKIGTQDYDKNMSSKFEPKIHVFYCVNAFDRGVFPTHDSKNAVHIQSIKKCPARP